jgi:hypothetical protein
LRVSRPRGLASMLHLEDVTMITIDPTLLSHVTGGATPCEDKADSLALKATQDYSFTLAQSKQFNQTFIKYRASNLRTCKALERRGISPLAVPQPM